MQCCSVVPRSEHSAQAEMLDMHEAGGSSPGPPTIHRSVPLGWASGYEFRADPCGIPLRDRLTAQVVHVRRYVRGSGQALC